MVWSFSNVSFFSFLRNAASELYNTLDGTLALSNLEGSSSGSKVHHDAGGAVSYTILVSF